MANLLALPVFHSMNDWGNDIECHIEMSTKCIHCSGNAFVLEFQNGYFQFFIFNSWEIQKYSKANPKCLTSFFLFWCLIKKQAFHFHLMFPTKWQAAHVDQLTLKFMCFVQLHAPTIHLSIKQKFVQKVNIDVFKSHTNCPFEWAIFGQSASHGT